MKLELKHITPYLPYKLQILENNHVIRELYGINYNGEELILSYNGIGEETVDIDESDFKPILRPLLDLVLDDFDVIYENETDFESMVDLTNLDAESFLCTKFSYQFWEKLFENHFDVFGLIKYGLAVDINTI